MKMQEIKKTPYLLLTYNKYMTFEYCYSDNSLAQSYFFQKKSL